jgi:D-alanyl-lipoteichoic acid acyltransferase DltB (MBOAT superfamily)
LASLAFYARWDWRFAPLLVVSLLVNFGLGRLLAGRAAAGAAAGGVLAAGLAWNLGLLGYFKYWNFFLDNLNVLTGSGMKLEKIVLPLGISFFTFQKIAFLVDAWKGKVKELRFLDFSLFVMFFPQLIAGPIVHHGEFIPQIREEGLVRFKAREACLGLALFAAGLFQKCVVADTLAPVADSCFGMAAQGVHLRMMEAWIGVAAYSLQLFYDFSGYSHMALGLALLFGFRLPVNFLAPYRAGSMIEFWRRWHITLSAFLRDYVYIPLGGNRNRHLTNLFFTMLLAGFWHGAGWTFVIWGAWHGGSLVANHLWRRWRHRGSALVEGAEAPLWARFVTLVVVALGWVLFRAPDLGTVLLLFQSLAGWHGISVPVGWHAWVEPLAPVVRARGLMPNLVATPSALMMLVVAGWLACTGPQLLRWLGIGESELTQPAKWQRPELGIPGAALSPWRAVLCGLMFATAVAALSRSTVFLYFQF